MPSSHEENLYNDNVFARRNPMQKKNVLIRIARIRPAYSANTYLEYARDGYTFYHSPHNK